MAKSYQKKKRLNEIKGIANKVKKDWHQILREKLTLQKGCQVGQVKVALRKDGVSYNFLIIL